VNKKWRKARLVGSYRGQDVDPEIHTRNERRLNRRLFGFAFVDDFDDVMRGLGHEPHLGNLGMGVLGSDADGHARGPDPARILRLAADG
jgi:hypothetical protein